MLLSYFLNPQRRCLAVHNVQSLVVSNFVVTAAVIEMSQKIYSCSDSTAVARRQIENTKSPANAKGNAQQRYMFESPVKQNLSLLILAINFSRG